MALLHSIENTSGVVCMDAYSKIDAVSLDKELARITVSTFKDVGARTAGKQPLNVTTHNMVIANGNVSWVDIYHFLKTRGYFDGAVDA